MKLTSAVVVALVVGVVTGWVGHEFWNGARIAENFDSVSRASKAVDSAVSVGVAYQKKSCD